MADITPDPIMRIATGFMAAKHLFVASEIGVFENLANGPATLDELAAKSGIPRRTLRISADAMVSLGLLEREGDRYRNSAVAAAYLAGRAGPDLRPAIRLLDRIGYPTWMKLEDAVRRGEGERHFGRFTEEEQQIFSAGVEAITAGMAALLAESYDFSRHRRVLDVGGGTGSFLIAVLRRHPTLIRRCRQRFSSCRAPAPLPAVALQPEGEGTRVAVVEGDLFKDPLPDGHDAIIVANTAHVPLGGQHCGVIEEHAQSCGGRRTAAARRLVDGFDPHPAARCTNNVGRVSAHVGRGADLFRRRG